MSRCQNSLSSLGSRKLGVTFGGALSLSMVLQKRAKEEGRKGKGQGQGKGKGKDRKR